MAQKHKQPTALELFKKYQPKFRTVQWESCGFPKHESSRNHHFLPEGGNYEWRHPCHLDVNDNGLALLFTFDPSIASAGPLEQLQSAVWQAILLGSFAGRTFYADPENQESVKRSIREEINGSSSNTKIRIAFSHDGPPIRGLSLRQDMLANGWRFFVPPDSPEGMVVSNALAFERAKVKESMSRGYSADIKKLREDLDSALGRVSA